MGMGISTIGLMENMPAVIFSVVIGTGIGLAIHLGERINAGAGVMAACDRQIYQEFKFRAF